MEAIIPAILVGFFTLAGLFIQNRHHALEMSKRMAHERLMAEEAFQREKVACENDRLAERIAEQLSWGERIAVSVGRAKHAYSKASTREERTQALGKVMAFAGVNPDGYYPLSSLLEPEVLEDDELRALVSNHREVIDKALLDLILQSDYRPEILPQDPLAFVEEVKGLKKRIEVRVRQLKRQGRPL
jgi:hypothetical protein